MEQQSNVTAQWDMTGAAKREFNNILNGNPLSDPSRVYFRWPSYESIKNPGLYDDSRGRWNYGVINIPK